MTTQITRVAASVAAGVVFLVAGCSSTPQLRTETIQIRQLVPAEKRIDTDGIKRMAVVCDLAPEVDGVNEPLASTVISALSESLELAKFRLTDPDTIKQVVDQANFDADNPLEVADALKAKLDVNAILYAKITDVTVEHEEKDVLRDNAGSLISGILNFNKESDDGQDTALTVRRAVPVVTLSITFNLMATRNNRSVLSEQVTRRLPTDEEYRQMAETEASTINVEELKTRIVREAALAFVGQFVPTKRNISVLMASADTNPELREETKDTLRRGIIYAKSGVFDKAAECFVGLTERYPECAAAWYNLGILQEAQGQFEQAVESFDKAASIAAIELYAEALARCRKRVTQALASAGG